MFKGLKRRWDEMNRQRAAERERLFHEAMLARRQREREEQEAREARAKCIAIVSEGKVPDVPLDITVPFRLLKNERWILAADGVGYAEKRVRREFRGRSAGASVRVMKGVSVRTGESRGTSVEVDELTYRGTGTLALSTRHLFFHGERSFRIPFAKMVSVRYAADVGAVEVVRDRASALPEYFGVTGEYAEFIVELLHLLPSVDFGTGAPEVQAVEDYALPFGVTGADDMLEND